MLFRLFMGAACIGMAPIFVRLVHLQPTPIGIYRCGLASLLLLVLILFSGKKMTPLSWPLAVWKLVGLAGALFALDLYIWHRSVIYAGAGMGTILGNTQVFYVALIGALLYSERLSFRFVTAVLIAFAGIYFLVSYRLISQELPNYHLGVLFGLSTGVVYAFYILTVRKIEALSERPPTEQVLAFISLITALCLLPISIWEGSLRLPEPMEWLWLFVLALVAQVIGWLLISRTLPQLPVSRAGLVLNAQPVVAVIAGNLFLGEHLSLLQIVGACLTLFAIYLGNYR